MTHDRSFDYQNSYSVGSNDCAWKRFFGSDADDNCGQALGSESNRKLHTYNYTLCRTYVREDEKEVADLQLHHWTNDSDSSVDLSMLIQQLNVNMSHNLFMSNLVPTGHCRFKELSQSNITSAAWCFNNCAIGIIHSTFVIGRLLKRERYIEQNSLDLRMYLYCSAIARYAEIGCRHLWYCR